MLLSDLSNSQVPAMLVQSSGNLATSQDTDAQCSQCDFSCFSDSFVRIDMAIKQLSGSYLCAGQKLLVASQADLITEHTPYMYFIPALAPTH